MKIFTWLWLLLFILQIAACEKPIPPQAQAFLNMRKAICEGGSLASAKPFVTERSKSALDFTQALMPLAQIFTGERMDDALAKDCQNTPKVINQIKVNDKRYLIQFILTTDNNEKNEVAVVLENGEWKVQLSEFFSNSDDILKNDGKNKSNKVTPIFDRKAGIHAPSAPIITDRDSDEANAERLRIRNLGDEALNPEQLRIRKLGEEKPFN